MRILLLLLLAPCAFGQTPAKVHAVGACNTETIQSVISLFAQQEAAPKFELFVFCQAADWKEFLVHFKINPSANAFTDWTHGKIYLGANLDSPVDLRRTIRHELAHLRCACLLGEH